MRLICSILLFSAALCMRAYGVGESAVITLVFPYGVAGTGMGELGTAIADDESALFYNPAALGFYNTRWHGGSLMQFYEPILPAFGISDLWHAAFAGCYQPQWCTVGTFGISWNYLNFGENTWTDELGATLGRARSFEQVIALSYGTALGLPGEERHGVGLSMKYVHSALAPGYGPHGEGVSRSFAVDLGYQYRFPFGLRLAGMLRNMGPAVFYIDPRESDPIPFTIDAAVGFDRVFAVAGMQLIRVRAEYRADKETVRNHIDTLPDPFWKAIYTDLLNDTTETWREELRDDLIHHVGAELTIFNTLAFRYGYMHDKSGCRRESSFGIGVRALNHIQTDWSIIVAPGDMSVARHLQWRIGVSVFRLAAWSEQDLLWWKEG